MAQKILDALTKKFAAAIEQTTAQHGDEVAYVARDRLHEVAQWLKDDPAMAFDAPVFATCIDVLELARPNANGRVEMVDVGAVPRFEVCYQLRSTKHRHRVRLKIRVPESDARVASLAGLWPAFDWQERETFDMYGIRFVGHPDLRRIYL